MMSSVHFWYCVIIFAGAFEWRRAKGSAANTEVSFYGESYVLNPVQDASNSTWISLEFRTHQPQGLLMLAAGGTDYIIMQLNAGIVETRINLGSGEAVTFSARGVRLDNYQWHSVVVNRTVDTVFLEVDGAVQGQATTPGTYHDLNVDLGIFLGGSESLKQTSYKNMKSFRGCLRNVLFNGRDILGEARALNKVEYAFLVSWHCDEVFFASPDSPISLSHDTSFIALPHLRVNPESVFSCQLKTRSSNAVVLFNSGAGATWEDFIAVELVEGKPKLSINKGSGVVEVVLESAINDGKWHRLEVTVSESVAALRLDSERNMTRFHLGTQNTLNLANHLFVGGVGVKARSSAHKIGLAALQGENAMRGSMLGCFKDIIINSRNYGLQQIQMSRLITAECMWEFPCAQDPCIPNAYCIELQGSDFRCDCDQQVCVKDQFKSKLNEDNNDFNRILSVGKIQVTDGGSALIDVNVIKIQQDYFKHAVREENVIFTVKKQPQMGIIETENRRGSQHSFTLRDVMTSSVHYRHYGGHSKFDSITLELTFTSLTPDAESKLRERYDFVLPVTVIPQVQGKLEVVLHLGNVLSITSGAKFRVTPSVVDVKGAENVDPSTLKFVVVYLRQSPSMFERSSAPGVSILSFTLQEVQENMIWFQHSTDKMVYTKVNVTDGSRTSEAVDLRFKEETLSITVVNNTGLSIAYGIESLITSTNLSSVVNVKVEDLEVQYHITQPPSHGAVQCQDHEEVEWADVETFTQRHINWGRLRYQHLPSTSITNYDSFKFEAISKDVKTGIQTFNINFKTLTLTVKHNTNLLLHQVPFGKFSEKILLVISSADQINLRNIVYTVLRAPQKGSLYLIKRNIHHVNFFDQIPPMKVDSTFTQQDINDGCVYYKLDRPSLDKQDDFTDLQASYFGYTVMVRSMIQYVPEKTQIRFVNNGLKDVVEGDSAVISRKELSLEMDMFKKFAFSVLRYPSHGSINIIDPASSGILRRNVSSFTMTEIKEGKVAYYHDDSESKEDSFVFTATPILDESEVSIHGEIQEYSGTFHINMKMKNDNPPARVFAKVFQVATGQVKHLTINDLSFTDPDIDYDDSLLFYQRQSISNGEILSAVTEEPVYNFTQEDLMNRALIFKHRGSSYAQTPILVTDGQFFSTSLFEIQASAPFIRVNNNTGVEVRQGQYATISDQNLSIDTNVDFNPEDISFQLTEEPKHGHIRARGQKVSKFYYSDLLTGQVKYWHERGGSVLDDGFTANIKLASVQTRVTFSVRVIAEGVSDPPEIIHNRILKVASMQAETISDNILQVSHKNYNPDEIEYIITQLPQHGHLIIKGKPVKPGSAPEFTQKDINSEQIIYKSGSPDHLSDKFVFDVGTDIQSLRHLEFLIEIIPPSHQVNQVNILVSEGGMVMLSDRNVHFRARSSQSKKSAFLIQSTPVHGKIVVKRDKKNTSVSSFTSDDILQGQVFYSHDDSESLFDEFTLKEEETGQLYHIIVNVTSINDQPPYISVNTGLDMWSGSLHLLTNKHLQASDPDSSSEEVEFHVMAPNNGHLAFLNNTFRHISRFSQKDLDSGQVVFVHKGSELGEFKFQATDGTNKDEFRVFVVRARPVKITVSSNSSVKSFPNSIQPISNSSLKAVTSAHNFTHPIIFSVIEPKPQKGRIVTLINKRIVEIISFTQQEIDERKIYFQHTGSMRSWKETEVVYFEITTTYAQPVSGHALPVDISFENINEENYQELLKMNDFIVQEGSKAAITRSYFDSTEMVEKIRSFKPGVNVVFSFSSSVRHGDLWFKDKDAEIGEEFTQDDLNSGGLVYKHDHSDSKDDFFQFVLKILIPRTHSDSSTSVARTFNFMVIVDPINDQGFELVTRHPSIRVKQGDMVVVTAHNLTTVDLDTGPEGIEYIVLTQPDNGMLVKLTDVRTRLQTFTQKDINDRMIVFKHDGSRRTSGTLYFQVWDRKFDPWHANLEIKVVPIIIEVAKNRHLPLIQGQNYIALSNTYLRVSTNGDSNALIYNVTQAPQFGKLMKHSSRVSKFTQADVNSGHLLYIQDDDSPGDDFFVCDIDHTNLDCSLDTVQFDVIMKPRVRQGPLITSPGSHVAITRSSLDASELAQITNDNPLFTIVVPPRHGHIMRRHRQRRQATLENSFQPVSNFTFEDIVYTKIYYVPSDQERHSSSDKFIYTLTSRGVPPARGEFVIQLDTPGYDGSKDSGDIDGDIYDMNPDSDIPDGERGHTGEDDVVSASVGSDTDDGNVVVVATVVTLIILLIIAVVLVILFLRWRRQNGTAAREVKPVKPRPVISGPLQLEQPHVMIEPKHEVLGSPASGEGAALVSQDREENQYVNTSLMNSSQEADSLLPFTSQPSSSQSPDVTRVEYSQPVRGNKATPAASDSQSDQISEDTDRRSTMTSGRGSDASDLLDWTLMDPDLLQQCRITTPVLRNNQYWL